LFDVESTYEHNKSPVITSSNVFKPLSNLSQPVFTQDSKIKFQGIGQTLDKGNEFVFPILHGEISTQSREIEGIEKSSNIGEQLTLVSGYQSLNNHRAIFTGSMSMCSDEFFAWY
jgi:hypothetical protein